MATDSLERPGDADRHPTIVITFCWSFGIPGGVARHIQELSRALALAGAKVIIVSIRTMRYSRFPRPKLPKEFLGTEAEAELAPLGVEVIRPFPHPLHWTLDEGIMRDTIAQLLASRPVDAVLSFYNEAARLPDVCARHGVTFGIVATWQSYAMAWKEEMERPGLRGIYRRRVYRRGVIEPYRRAQVLFANSEFTRQELVDVLGIQPDRIRVSYLGVDPKFASVPRPERPAVRNLLFFGRLFTPKGVFDALRALGKLHAEGVRDWNMRILGTGPRPTVRKTIEELGLQDRVEMMLHQQDDGLLEQLAWADLAILPSHSESFGLAIAEANAAGLPVVAFAAGSVPEVVLDGETAWLVPLGDTDALAGAIRAAIEDPAEARRRGLAGRERVLSTFRWDLTARRVLDGIAATRAATAGTG